MNTKILSVLFVLLNPNDNVITKLGITNTITCDLIKMFFNKYYFLKKGIEIKFFKTFYTTNKVKFTSLTSLVNTLSTKIFIVNFATYIISH